MIQWAFGLPPHHAPQQTYNKQTNKQNKQNKQTDKQTNKTHNNKPIKPTTPQQASTQTN
jgi:hypothetical protein